MDLWGYLLKLKENISLNILSCPQRVSQNIQQMTNLSFYSFIKICSWSNLGLKMISDINLFALYTKYRPGPWCDLLSLSGLLAAPPGTETVLVHGCRPTVSGTLRISIRPSARAPGPLSKAAAAHRPATSVRMRSVGRSITAGPAGPAGPPHNRSMGSSPCVPRALRPGN